MSARGVHVIPVPTPFAVGRVNCYLVDDDPLTLVDCGPNSGTALVTLEQGLAEHGRKVEELERIVLTHQHIDHTGLAQILADRSGAEIVGLDLLGPFLRRYRESMEADDAYGEALMRRHGVPADVAVALRGVVSLFRAWGAKAELTTPVQAGATLEFADRSWRIEHRPGHSPTDTVFIDDARRVMVGGDHLLGAISSNPLITRPERDGDPRPRSLAIYLDSMRKTAAEDVETILPGHGEPVTGHADLIAVRERMHARRADKIHATLTERPRTAHEVAEAMWGSVALTQTYLTISEVLGHVDLLLEDGRVVEDEADDVVVLHPA